MRARIDELPLVQLPAVGRGSNAAVIGAQWCWLEVRPKQWGETKSSQMGTLGRGRAADGGALAGARDAAGAFRPYRGCTCQPVAILRLPAEGAAAGTNYRSQGVGQLSHQLLAKPVVGVGVTRGPATLAGVLLVGGDHGAAALLGPVLYYVLAQIRLKRGLLR